jgi:hypothetical protein
MQRSIKALAAALLASGTLLAAPALQAQTRAPQAQPNPPSGSMEKSTTAIPDEKLDAAAVAITKVNTISKDYKQRFDAAPPDDRARIADEADAALEKAVNESGLSVEEYNSIIDVALNDPDTQSKILQRLQVPPDQQ